MEHAALEIKNSFKQYLARREKLPEAGQSDAVSDAFDAFIKRERLILKASRLSAIKAELVEEITAYGALTPLFADQEITEIMVNGTRSVYIEKHGLITPARQRFESEADVYRLIERILSPVGARVDESLPYADGRLADGSRVNVIIPPVSLDGPVVTIRRFPLSPMSLGDLVNASTLEQREAKRIAGAAKEKRNIVISGGTGTGKTTFLNALAACIPDNERLVTVEDAAELRLPKPHVVRLQTRPPNSEGKGEVTARSLVKNALRMRPDRIIVGEARGGEALDMLQAMNTGHEGSMTTVHANSCADAIRRLEVMVLMAGLGLPHSAVRDLIVSSLDLILQLERTPDGSRRLVEIFDCAELKVDA